MWHGNRISPQEQQDSEKKRYSKAASIDSRNTAATFCRNRVNLRNLHSISRQIRTNFERTR